MNPGVMSYSLVVGKIASTHGYGSRIIGLQYNRARVGKKITDKGLVL